MKDEILTEAHPLEPFFRKQQTAYVWDISTETE